MMMMLKGEVLVLIVILLVVLVVGIVQHQKIYDTGRIPMTVNVVHEVLNERVSYLDYTQRIKIRHTGGQDLKSKKNGDIGPHFGP